VEFRDYYKTLGVERDAEATEVQKAYRRLARKYHPDVNKEADAENRFKEIGEAYEVLRDPQKRAKYDQYGSAWNRAQSTGGAAPSGYEEFVFDFGNAARGGGFDFGGGAGGGSGFSSFFEMLFGNDPEARFGGAQPGPGRGRARSAPGRDRESTLAVELEELARGGQTKIEFVDPATGERKSLRVTLPKGALPGQRIRLAGQGEPGAGGQTGDLLLKLEQVPHPRFRLEGRDLHTKLAIAPWEAVLGGTATVDTLSGPVSIRLPSGSSSGRKIRLRGRGMPNPAGADGDLIVELQMVVPEHPTPEERELYERLREGSTFSPRPGERSERSEEPQPADRGARS
jgi:curved DNA-binding protein